MDPGRHRDDGPDDVEAAPDSDTIDLTADGGGPSADEPPTLEPTVGQGVDAAEATAIDDRRPAVWLADIGARAPWLLGPSGASRWVAAGTEEPDVIPHGTTPSAPTWAVAEAVQPASPRALDATPWRDPGSIREVSSNQNTAGGAGPPAPAGGPRVPGEPVAGAPSSDALLHPPRPLEGLSPTPDVPIGPDPRRVPDADPGAPEGGLRWGPESSRFATEAAGRSARPDLAPDVPTPLDDHGAPGHDPWPELDPRRPAIQRSSATWPARPPGPSGAAGSSPVWPPRPHPQGAGLLGQRPIPEPGRPPHRPVTPFVADPRGPASPDLRPARPTWSEDRSGWHASAVPVARIVDDTALPPWPSLLDDDDDDGDGPDWTALERGFERRLRLEREQRRR